MCKTSNLDRKMGRIHKVLFVIAIGLSGIYSVVNAVHKSEERHQHRVTVLKKATNTKAIHKLVSESPLIAHGGGIHHFLYSNCAEAVADSISRGFSFIELDLLVTSDGHIIAAHDWSHFRALTNHKEGKLNTPLDLPTATQLKINIRKPGEEKHLAHTLSGADINRLMNNNQNIILVTDKITDFELLLHEIPHPDRMIVEVFSPLEYERALCAGVKYPAFCVLNQAGLKQACQHEYNFLTINANLFLNNIDTMRKLHQKQVVIMVYGTESIDAREFALKYIGSAASMIYTGKLEPKDIQ